MTFLRPGLATIVASQTKHVPDVQRVRMESEALPFVVPLPDCPRVQTAFCAGGFFLGLSAFLSGFCGGFIRLLWGFGGRFFWVWVFGVFQWDL